MLSHTSWSGAVTVAPRRGSLLLWFHGSPDHVSIQVSRDPLWMEKLLKPRPWLGLFSDPRRIK
jgi:hypothetical protein